MRGEMNRKGFLKAVGLAVGTWFISACSKIGINIDNEAVITPVSKPTEEILVEEPTVITTEESTQESEENLMAKSGKVKIAFVKTDDRVYGVKKAIEIFGINPVEGKTVLLKPNFNSDHPTPGSTHPDVLREMVIQLQQMGAASITIGDRSGMKETREVMNNLGVFSMAEELGVETVVFNELGADEWLKIENAGSHWSRGFYFPEPALRAGAIVQTCCLKTHQYGGHFTMSLKNSVGLVAKTVPGDKHNYMTELHNSPHQRSMIAEINSVYEPALVVMDGVEAFTDGGPHQGTRVNSNVVLAGTDMVALDAVGVAILRYFGTTPEVSTGSVFEQEQIARAVELDLGVDSPDKIEFITPDEESAAYAREIKKILKA
jgi:uncharacterized protein (DUF362 family)